MPNRGYYYFWLFFRLRGRSFHFNCRGGRKKKKRRGTMVHPDVLRPPGHSAINYRSDAVTFKTVKVPEKVRD